MKKRSSFLFAYTLLFCLFAFFACREPIHPHTPSDWITDTTPTCTQTGSRHRTCTECGETIDTDTLPQTGHTYANAWTVAEEIHFLPCLNDGCQAASEVYEHSHDENGECIVCGHTTTVSRGLFYHLNDDGTGYMLTGVGDYVDANIVVPAIYNGLPVTYVYSNAFSFMSGIIDITLPHTVIGIGASAFNECTDLENIKLPAGLTEIGERAFYGTPLKSIHIPAEIEAIRNGTFANCENLASLTFAEDSRLKVIEQVAFIRCKKLKSISFPTELTTIDSAAFQSCNALEHLDFTVSDRLTDIGDYAFSDCHNLQKVSFGFESHLMSIGRRAFDGCRSLTSIHTVGSDADFTIPFSVTTIGSAAFASCTTLRLVELPESVTSIGSSAFSGCSNLQHIGLPVGLTRISDHMFSDCPGLESIRIPAGVTEIDKFAFYKCTSLKSVEFEEDTQLTTLKNAAFYGCSALENVVIPAGVSSMEFQAFAYCDALRNVIFMDTDTWYAEIFAINPTDLADPQKAAKILAYYCNFNWAKT